MKSVYHPATDTCLEMSDEDYARSNPNFNYGYGEDLQKIIDMVKLKMPDRFRDFESLRSKVDMLYKAYIQSNGLSGPGYTDFKTITDNNGRWIINPVFLHPNTFKDVPGAKAAMLSYKKVWPNIRVRQKVQSGMMIMPKVLTT